MPTQRAGETGAAGYPPRASRSRTLEVPQSTVAPDEVDGRPAEKSFLSATWGRALRFRDLKKEDGQSVCSMHREARVARRKSIALGAGSMR